ncbi:neutral/alkaline nonlysosomal ceramidase [Rhizoctonia solani 123E]|uniref:Neutral ceramidase n=1 Tax=Rhizoctonia solani 123E TaxID=1423351 RepID=A0A074RR48_9AGAM|nr:neutral/alkaline nonlysosomal ceramidase [Rhizoctonia solani 123E]
MVSHGQIVNVEGPAHGVATAITFSSTPLQYLSDWGNSLYGAVVIMVKYLSTWFLLFTATLFGGNGGKFGVQSANAQQYLLGLGIGDVTGPIVETNMMGYAALSQTDTGLHMRQFSRAYIIATPGTNTAKDRILFVNSDLQSGDTAIRRGVLERLQQLYPGLYTEANFALVGTHSHAGVGGFLNNLLPQLTSLGFVKQTYDAIVNGTVLAIQRAHDSLALGTLSVGNTTILDTNINRSPFAYEANPAEERARYKFDQDKELHLLKFKGENGTDRGFLSFFAVHGTSLYENNTLVSADNKGMAAYLYEAYAQPDALPGKNTFVAGFVQANVGDTSPNTLGAYCESPGQPWDGQPCEYQKSTCGNKTQDCHGRGPGFRVSDFESNLIIGTNQFNGAKTLMGSTLASISGAVRSLHSYVNMSSYSFALTNGTTVTTCPPAMGYSFAGGTTDGPGAFDFTQGDNSTSQNPFWEIVKGAVTAPPSEQQKACHYPKPILLNTGYANTPYPWQPSIVDIQMFRIGQLVMLIFPGELTTMSGRRLREAVRAKLISSGVIGSNAYVIVAGPANTYAHYVTTREEYSIQRYEGASTIYGPFTLEAYTDLFTKYTPYLADSASGAPPAGPTPEDLTKKAISLQTGVAFDASPIGKSFGSVLTDVTTSTPYKRGQTVTAVFQGANPRNNLRLESTFMTIDTLIGGTWRTVRTDSHPSTKFGWLRTNTILGYSTVTANWTIESTTPAGSYRISYYGNNKPLIGSIGSFTGTTSNFTISV